MLQTAMDLYAWIVFEKTAASKWQRMLDAGQIGLEELKRLAPRAVAKAEAQGVRRATPSLRAEARTLLQAPAQELYGEALSRRQHLEPMLESLSIRRAGGSTRDTSRRGPHIEQKPNLMSFISGQPKTLAAPVVDAQAGTQLRHASDDGAIGRFKAQMLAGAGPLPPEVYRGIERPVDRSLFRMTGAHERMEAHGVNLMDRGLLPPNMIASHMNEAVVPAERLATRDAEALARMDNIRKEDGSDGYALWKRWREAGLVANHTPPLGGRANRSVAHQIARTPATEAAHLRMLTGGPRSEAGVARVQALAEPPSLFERMLPQQLKSPARQIHREVAQKALAASERNGPGPTFSRDNPDHVRAYLAHLTHA